MKVWKDPRVRTVFETSDVKLAVLFGSAAADRLRPDSDIDIGILPTRDLTLAAEARIAVALERLLGREVDLVRLDLASTLLRFQAARGQLLYEAERGVFAAFVSRALLEHDDLRPILKRCADGMFRALTRSA